MILYMQVTKDEYELPLAVAASPQELARMCRTTANSIKSALSHKNKGWVRIEMEDELCSR